MPSTTWAWTDVSSTKWTDYAPTVDGDDSTAGSGYVSQWDYSSPTYSREHHELWVHGGGHAGTSLNAASRYNLSANAPTITFISSATSKTIRNTEAASPTFTTAYHSDGKPYSSHTYRNLCYSDSTDELLVVGFGFMGQGIPFTGSAWSLPDVAAMTRAGSWRAADYYADLPGAGGNHMSPKMTSVDGTKVYWWSTPDAAAGGSLTQLYALDLSAKTHSLIGSSAIGWYSRQAENDSGTALVMGGADSSGGWQASFCDLSTGAITAITMSGDSLPSGLEIYDLVWCSDKGYWVAMWMDETYNWGATITTIRIATITQNSSSTATASIKTLTGTAPTVHKAYRGMFYDPAYSALIFALTPSANLKAMKVA